VKKSLRRTTPRLEVLGERVNPVVINGTAGNDVITTELLFNEGATDPHAANVLLNGSVAGTVNITGAWPFPTTSYFIDQELTINGLGGNDRVEVGLLRPRDGDRIHLNGGPGNDTLVGGNGHDHIDGGPGADDMFGGIDEDTLFGDMADVRLVGGGGQDRLEMNVAGVVKITDTSLTIGGRTLSDAAGTYGGFFAIVLNGSSGNDVLDASAFTNVVVELFGNGGNDVLASGASSRTLLDGGPGNDILFGSPADDTLAGGNGNDLLIGGNDTFPDFTINRLFGGAGNDTMLGATGPNQMFGGPGNDDLVGGPRGDGLYGEQGNDSLNGGDGNDLLQGDGDDTGQPPTYSGADFLDGAAGEDALVADGLDRRLFGGPGLDGLTVSTARGNIALTDTTWRVGTRLGEAGGLEFASINGSAFNDTIDVTGYTGFANLFGLGGNDTLRAGPGGSNLDGGPGADALFGGTASDTMTGDAADARFVGGGSSDVLSVANLTGSAVLTDTTLTINGRAIPTTAIATVILMGGDGANTLDATAYTGLASLYGNGGNDTLLGGSAGSYLQGGDGDDSLVGGSANDTLFGEGGTDTLNAGGGDDYLDGGTGTDDLTGGTGADQFVKDADPEVYAIEIAASDFSAGEGDTEV